MTTKIAPQRLLRPLTRAAREVRSASANARQVSPGRQLEIWRRGFYADHAMLYDFDRFGFDAYVSDYVRATRFGRGNRAPHRQLLDDKLVTFLYLDAIGAPTPRVFGFSSHGRTEFFEARNGGGLEALVQEHGRIVIKPRGGSGGDGFHLLEADGDRILDNGEPTDDLSACLRGDVVVSEFLEQHDYARTIFPGAANTIRLLTLTDPETNEPFVAFGLHRFGTSASEPVDNTSRGGMTSAI